MSDVSTRERKPDPRIADSVDTRPPPSVLTLASRLLAVGTTAAFALAAVLVGLGWLWILDFDWWQVAAAASVSLPLWFFAVVRLSAGVGPGRRAKAGLGDKAGESDTGTGQTGATHPAVPAVKEPGPRPPAEVPQDKPPAKQTGPAQLQPEHARTAPAPPAPIVPVIPALGDVAAQLESSIRAVVAPVPTGDKEPQPPGRPVPAAAVSPRREPEPRGETPTPKLEPGAPPMTIRRAPSPLLNVSTGLDLGSYEMKFVQVAHSREGPVVVAFGAARTPPQAINDGKIADVAAVANAVRFLLQGARTRPKRVTTCASSKSVILRVLPFPRMRHAELAGVLSHHGEQYIPIPREKAAVAFSILDTPDRLDSQMEVLVAATSKEVPEVMDKTLRAARLRMAALDVDGLAAFRALRLGGFLDHLDPATLVVVLDFGALATRIGLFWQDAPRLVRSVPIGGIAFTSMVAEELGLSIEEAERVKRTQGLAPGSATRAVLLPEVDRLLGELRQSVEWFMARNRGARQGAVYLIGGGAVLDGLVSDVRRSLDSYLVARFAGKSVPVAVGGIGRTTALDQRLVDRQSQFGAQYVTALGLALRS